MTTMQVKLDIPVRLAREEQAAGLLTPSSMKQLLQDAIRRRAGEALMTAAQRAKQAGGKPPSLTGLVAEVKAVRAALSVRPSHLAFWKNPPSAR